MRYFLEIAYNGKNYHGWQIQQNAHSIQSQFNGALLQLFGKSIETIASGRTDTGVHALRQIVQLDLDIPLTKDHLFSLNRILPFDIAIHQAYEVTPASHARFDALSRKYEYWICKTKNPFKRDTAYYFSKKLNLGQMNAACTMLKEHEDFECFSKVNTAVEHFRCNILEAYWKEENEMLLFTIEANRFLRGMVRAIVGTLLEIGLERKAPEEIEKIILSKDRKAAGRAVPAHGLFLTDIKYPDEIFIKI